MDQKNITVDIGPIVKALKGFISDAQAPGLQGGEARALLESITQLYALMQLAPSVERDIHREIGLNALALLAYHVASQKVAEDLISRVSAD